MKFIDSPTVSEAGLSPGREAFPVTRASILTAYRRMAPSYDCLFGPLLEPGRRRVVRALGARAGDRVLEVGVGTGLSLRHWNPNAHVTGIDFSTSMLARARRMRKKRKLAHVELCEMDAQAMTFPDSHFAMVAAMYVVSVVENLEALLREMIRVCRPGGRIAIVNHFEHPQTQLRWGERALSRYAGLLGFNPAIRLERILQANDLRILEVRPVDWLGFWTMVVAEPDK